ncbi:MAG: thiolase family protein [Planctomycetota bacterium]|nr:thiolase family protein [Planctomycetota bacterium]
MIQLSNGGPSRSIVLAAGLRTPQARSGGVFKKEDPGHLASRLARELLNRAGMDPGELDEVISGCAGPPQTQANVSRVIALRAGVPEHVPARTVARNCASGMEAVTSACASILAGEGDTYLCLGVEVMSGYPLVFGPKMTGLFERAFTARSPLQAAAAWLSFRPSFLTPRVALMEGLTDPISGMIMGNTAELLARDFAISREQSDAFACESHARARDARERGRFEREIHPHLPLGAREGARALDRDDSIRDEQTVEALGRLKPYFTKPDGTVTVGNSCGITDGATALLVMTEERARELGLTPLARIRSWAWAGLDPARMGLGPVFATAKALDRAGCELGDLGAIELNEAFACQVLACARAFESDAFAEKHLGRQKALGELDLARTNPNGGAIAIGHPVGATGARLLLTTAHELEQSDCELGLATLCIGGGQGGAVVLERVAR